MTLRAALLLTLAIPAALSSPVALAGECPSDNTDCDGDGVENVLDNCIFLANTDQTDADVDGLGNRCDPDFNDDGVVNFADLGFLKDRFFTADPVADLSGDGSVDFDDLAILREFFFLPAGPPGRLSFVNPQGGAWNDSRNWLPRSLPAERVVAAIEDVAGVTIDVGPGVVANGFVPVATDNNTLRLVGGTLRAAVDASFFGNTVGNSAVVASDSNLDNVAATIDFEVLDGSVATVTQDLTVFGDAIIRGTSLPTGLLFDGQQVFQVELIRFASEGNPDAGDSQVRSINGGLLIEPAAGRLTITGDRGTIGTPTEQATIDGDIVATGGDSVLSVVGSSTTFQGVGVALGGATLRYTNLEPTGAAFRIDSGGEILVEGDFIMVAPGALEFFASGPTPDEFGRISLSGSLDLADGALQLALIGYEPAAGDSLELIRYGTLTSPAGKLFLQDIGPDLDWVLDYGPDALSLDVVAQ